MIQFYQKFRLNSLKEKNIRSEHCEQGCGSAFIFADPDPAVLLSADPNPALKFVTNNLVKIFQELKKTKKDCPKGIKPRSWSKFTLLKKSQ